MTYGQYVSYKTQTRFPSYAEYINNKARGITTYQTYGPLQAMTGQYSTTYPRSPGYIPGMPTIERISIESGDCSEPRRLDIFTKIGSTANTLISFAYGLFHNLDGALKEAEAKRLVSGAIRLNDYVKADEYSIQAHSAKELSTLSTIAGAAMDLAFQLMTNDSASAAVAKTIAHAVFGYLGGAAAAALIMIAPAAGVFAPVVVSLAPVAAALISLGGSKLADMGIDALEERTGFFSSVDEAVSNIFNGLASVLFGNKSD